MPKARVDNIPQINGAFIYGSISIENLPDGTVPGQIPYWDGVQWQLITLVGEGVVDITFESSTNTLYFASVEGRIYQTFVADAILLKTVSATFTADAELV